MKEKKFGLGSQEYAAPRAESVTVAQESILCASCPSLKGQNEKFNISDAISW